MATATMDTIPQPKTYGPLGNLPQLDLQQPTQSILKLSYEYGPIFQLKFPSGTGIFISTPELVADASDESRFDKLVVAPLQKVRAFSGDGLFTSWTKEENWKKAHNILLPSFSQSAMKGYHSMMVDLALQLVQKWSRLNSGESIDVPADMTRLTLDTIGLCGFNYRFNSFYREKSHPFIRSMGRALNEAMNQSNRLELQDKLMVKSKRQFNRDIERMTSLVDRIIEDRKKSEDHAVEDLLSRMLNSEDPATGEKLDDENIRYQIITFLIAGHETTSGLLSFALYFLMKHPETLAKAYEEVDRVLTGPVPTYQQVRDLKYIRMILNESLRLWPTAPMFSLYAKEDTLLAGKYPLKRREVVNILLLKLHRDPTVWGDDAEEFRPERFLNIKDIPPHAYKPFGNGQRACIGQQFALHEATLLIGMILKQFKLIDHTNYELKVKETLTLKPDGFTMRVEPRSPHDSFAYMVQETSAAVEMEEQTNQAGLYNIETHGTPLLVLYGSNMGTAEGIAHGLANTAGQLGFQSEVAPLDAFIGKLPKDGVVFIVTSSYNGNPPKNARKFVKWLKEDVAETLSGVRYAVFGCGDTNWASTYQSIPNFIDESLSEKGAVRLVPKGQGDGSSDFEKQFADWHSLLWPNVIESFGLKMNDYSGETVNHLSVEFVSGLISTPLNETHAIPSTIIGNTELHGEGSIRHIEIALTEGVAYHEGDHIGILQQNSTSLVDRVLRRYGLHSTDHVILSGDRYSATHLPLERPVRVVDLLRSHVEIQVPVTHAQLRELAEVTVCPPHKRELEALLEEGAYKEVLQKRISMFDLLEKYLACELPFSRFLELLPALRTRYYSILSSRKIDLETASITVTVESGSGWNDYGEYQSIVSNNLANSKPGDYIELFICHSV